MVADSLVSTSALNPLQSEAALSTGRAASPPWEQVREQFRYRAGAAYDSASEFLFASPYVPRDEAFVEFARPSFLPGRPLPEAARDLMERIHDTMTYESESTEVNTPALEALKQGKGVCQDFAHIMVACCRAMGLPARYVSGYLLTSPPPGQPRLVGSDASHAWASVYCPGLGAWLDFDPTNNVLPSERHIWVGWGRDFSDVSPLKGVVLGGGAQRLTVGVDVEPQRTKESAPPKSSNGSVAPPSS